MKKLLVLLLSLTLCVGLLAACGGGEEPVAEPAPAPAATEPAPAPADTGDEYYSQDVSILNSTGVDIHYIYISPSEANTWGEDIMTDDVLAAGATVNVTFDVEATADYTWDIKTVDADGDEVVFAAIPLSQISTVELAYQDGTTPVAIFDAEPMGGADEPAGEFYSQDFQVTNSTGYDIMEMYVSLSTESSWQEDVLGDQVLAAGGTVNVTFDVVADETVTWDIRTVDVDGDEAIFTGLNLSAISHIELAYQDGTTPIANLT